MGVFGEPTPDLTDDQEELEHEGLADESELESAPAPKDNESRETVWEPKPRLYAGKYQTVDAMRDGIVSLADLIDDDIQIPIDSSPKSLEKEYRRLKRLRWSKQGGQNTRGKDAEPSPEGEESEPEAEGEEPGETGETPPDHANTLEVLRQHVEYLTAMSSQLNIPVELGAQDPLRQLSQPVVPNQTQVVQSQQEQFNAPEINLDETIPQVLVKAGLPPDADRLRDALEDNPYEVFQRVLRAAHAIVLMEADRQGKILGQGLMPVMQTVRSVQSERKFNQLAKPFLKAHPEYEPYRDRIQEIFLGMPVLQMIQGGYDAAGRQVTPGIMQAAQMARAEASIRRSGKNTGAKTGLRAPEGGRPRTRPKDDVTTRTLDAVFGPAGGKPGRPLF